jgi:hypothetical protein
MAISATTEFVDRVVECLQPLNEDRSNRTEHPCVGATGAHKQKFGIVLGACSVSGLSSALVTLVLGFLCVSMFLTEQNVAQDSCQVLVTSMSLG